MSIAKSHVFNRPVAISFICYAALSTTLFDDAVLSTW